MNILIVDPDEQTETVVKEALGNEASRIKRVSCAEDALKLLNAFTADLIILEVELENSNGIELCSELRSMKDIGAIVFYSSKEEEFIQIVALDSGADDYIIKPRRTYYLKSKIKSVMRKREISEKPKDDFILEPESYSVIKNGEQIYLARKEFQLFQLLFAHPNRIFKRSEIHDLLWEGEGNNTRILDVHIRHLREKIGEDLIKTVKGVGYGFIMKPMKAPLKENTSNF